MVEENVELKASRISSEHPGRDLSTAQFLLGLAAIALGQALQQHNGSFSMPALAWLTASLFFASLAVAAFKFQSLHIPGWLLWSVLGAGLLAQMAQLMTTEPGTFLLPRSLNTIGVFRALMGFAGVFALTSLLPFSQCRSWLKWSLFTGVMLAMGAAGVWMIHASPHPHIDVYVFEQSSSQALLQGKNPYELTPPNIYGNMAFYGPALVRDGKLTIGNPYPPLSIYLSTLGTLLAGDFRFSRLAAILLAAALIASTQRGKTSFLGAYLLLFTPRIFFVLEQGWTEPLVLLLATFTVWCALRRPKLAMLPFGLLLAVKQYMIFLFPLIFLLLPGSRRRREWAGALSTSAVAGTLVTAPLMLWNFPAFLWDVGLAQWKQVFRLDSLSFAALFARWSGHPPAQVLAFIILAVAIAIIFLKGGMRSPAGFAAAAGFCLAWFFAFSKQAFCNYYFLAAGLFCCALAAIPAMRAPEETVGNRFYP